MVLRILEVAKPFRPKTSHVYPPFKKGRYMEEYVYDYLVAHQNEIETDAVYLPVFWTNLQNHPGFSSMKEKYNVLLQSSFKKMPLGTTYFTIVQHDDGVQLDLPPHTVIFGACSGTIPLPLIYEDTDETLLRHPRTSYSQKDLLASFIGTLTTHPVRQKMASILHRKKDIYYYNRNEWSVHVEEEDRQRFIDTTVRSCFCLAPRGYGRSSFRFFEAMLLDTIPVYVWDDIEWLPYQEMLDYRSFSISVKKTELGSLEERLRTIGEEEYHQMVDSLRKVRHWFTLEGMSEYIVKRVNDTLRLP